LGHDRYPLTPATLLTGSTQRDIVPTAALGRHPNSGPGLASCSSLPQAELLFVLSDIVPAHSLVVVFPQSKLTAFARFYFPDSIEGRHVFIPSCTNETHFGGYDLRARPLVAADYRRA